jgi:hypothetical protein
MDWLLCDTCDLKLNPTKSVCMRNGPGFKITDCKIYLNEHPLVWKSDLRYLGLFTLSGKRFKCSLQQSKQKFYRAANGILGKIGLAYHCLILSLIDIFCMPVLTYGFEALCFSEGDRNLMDFVYSSIFFKIFNVKENKTIQQCQFFSGCLPTSYRLDLKTFNFFNGIKTQSNSLQLLLFTWFGQDELFKLSNKYSLLPDDSIVAM